MLSCPGLFFVFGRFFIEQVSYFKMEGSFSKLLLTFLLMFLILSSSYSFLYILWLLRWWLFFRKLISFHLGQESKWSIFSITYFKIISKFLQSYLTNSFEIHLKVIQNFFKFLLDIYVLSNVSLVSIIFEVFQHFFKVPSQIFL